MSRRTSAVVIPELLIWGLRYRIQRALGIECEWRVERTPHGYFVARCRWCGGLLKRG